MTPTCRLVQRWPHVLEPVDGQQVRGHGKVELVDEGGAFGRRVQEVADGGPQLAQLSLQEGSSTQPRFVPLPQRPGAEGVWARMSLTGVTVSFLRAELYCSSERRGSPLGKVRRGDLVAISQTPSYHSSGQSPMQIHLHRKILCYLLVSTLSRYAVLNWFNYFYCAFLLNLFSLLSCCKIWTSLQDQ